VTSDFGRIKVVCRGNKSISTISRRSEKLRGSLGVIRQAHRLKAGIRGLSSATNQLKRFPSEALYLDFHKTWRFAS